MNIYFEKLDSGYILHKDGKKIAVDNSVSLIDMLVENFAVAINSLPKVRNMKITVSVDENLPTLKED